MTEIVNQAQKHNAQQENDTINTIAVHCKYVSHARCRFRMIKTNFLVFFSLGTDKSSIFVAMCILVMQLKTEKRIDICSVVRKLRAQRNLMIETYVSL
jgi:protein-tyrosine phosphatase